MGHEKVKEELVKLMLMLSGDSTRWNSSDGGLYGSSICVQMISYSVEISIEYMHSFNLVIMGIFFSFVFLNASEWRSLLSRCT